MLNRVVMLSNVALKTKRTNATRVSDGNDLVLLVGSQLFNNDLREHVLCTGTILRERLAVTPPESVRELRHREAE